MHTNSSLPEIIEMDNNITWSNKTLIEWARDKIKPKWNEADIYEERRHEMKDSKSLDST